MASKSAIWRDYFVELNTEDSPVKYGIYEVGDFGITDINNETYKETERLVFSGTAWAAPSYSEDIFKVNINKICENYLTNEMIDLTTVPTNGTTITHKDAVKTFKIRNEDTGDVLDTVEFIYDWSFDKNVNHNSTVNKSHPINGRGVNGMFFFETQYNGTELKTTIKRTPTAQYEIVDSCNAGKYAIYYLNRYGGWDSYLIEGYVSRKDGFNRKTMLSDFDNGTVEFGQKPYMTETTVNYEIHTGWMNDSESNILAANLFQTTRAYLHNLETDDIIPIVINDADVLYKNHKNSGRRLLNYTINAYKAQTEYNKN